MKHYRDTVTGKKGGHGNSNSAYTVLSFEHAPNINVIESKM